jgi:hypothetical protein
MEIGLTLDSVIPKTPFSVPPTPSWKTHIDTLAQLLLRGQLVLFVGAGLSRLCPHSHRKDRRLPLWQELVAAARHRFAVPESITGLNVFDFIVQKHGRGQLDALVASLLDDAEFELSEAHRQVERCPWKRIYTTNFDRLLSRLYRAEPIVSECDYERMAGAGPEPSKPTPAIIHLHGRLGGPTTLTRGDYRLWQQRHPAAANRFLTTLLDHTLLIVGYGMGDPHIDEMLVLVSEWRAREHLPRRTSYAWMWNISDAERMLLEGQAIEAYSMETELAWAMGFRDLAEAYGDVARSCLRAGGESGGGHTDAAKQEEELQAAVFAEFVLNPWGLALARQSTKPVDVVFETLQRARDWADFFARLGLGETLRADIFAVSKSLSGENNPQQSLNAVRAYLGLLPL